MRQPHDLEQLLHIADEHDITLHGQANRRDLADPDDRFFLRIEVAHACRSSDDTSRRLRDGTVDRARKRAVEQDPEAVRTWLEETWPAIRATAKAVRLPRWATAVSGRE